MVLIGLAPAHGIDQVAAAAATDLELVRWALPLACSETEHPDRLLARSSAGNGAGTCPAGCTRTVASAASWWEGHRDDRPGVPLSPDEARALAEAAHAGQLEPTGAPLIAHVRRVALASPPFARNVGWLHEVLEWTTVPEEELLDAGVSDDELRALRLLTRPAPIQTRWATCPT